MAPNNKDDRPTSQLVKLREILNRIDTRPLPDSRSSDEIPGHGENLLASFPDFKNFLLGEGPSMRDVDLARDDSKMRDLDE